MLAFTLDMTYDQAIRLMELHSSMPFVGSNLVYRNHKDVWLYPETQEEYITVFHLPYTSFAEVLYILKEQENDGSANV